MPLTWGGPKNTLPFHPLPAVIPAEAAEEDILPEAVADTAFDIGTSPEESVKRNGSVSLLWKRALRQCLPIRVVFT